MRRFLLALCCGNREEADDIAQETLIKAYLSSGSYREEGKFTAWLYKIAHNTFIDRWKSRKLDAVEYIKQLQDRRLRKYRYAVAAAFLSGVTAGGLLSIFVFTLPETAFAFSWGTSSPLLLFIEQNGRLLLFLFTASLISYGIICLIHLLQEVTGWSFTIKESRN